jgi:hypothetical protein
MQFDQNSDEYFEKEEMPEDDIKFKGEKMVYEIKCAWCGKPMGTKNDKETMFAIQLKKQGFPVISHSICEVCKRQQKIINNKFRRIYNDNSCS